MNNFQKDPPTLQTQHIKYLRQKNVFRTKATKKWNMSDDFCNNKPQELLAYITFLRK
jgi:hypothetical protein